MTFKRLVLIILTVIAIALIGTDLLNSWNQPQIQSRLELYQTNLLLQARELKSADANVVAASQALLSGDPLETALEQYKTVRQQAEKNLEKVQTSLQAEAATQDPVDLKRLAETKTKLENLVTDLDINIGILQAEQGQTAAALQTWAAIAPQASEQDLSAATELPTTPAVLIGLWSQPARLLPEAEFTLKESLEGWFRLRSLSQLYQLQQRQEALQALQVTQQQAAEKAFESLAIVTAVPVIGCLIGVGILLFLLVQWFVQRKQALLAPETMPAWTVPWDGEIIWQVLIFGFFLVGQLILPFVLGGLKQAGLLGFAGTGSEGRAFLILINYILLAAGGLAVLYWSIKPYLPLPEEWFRFELRGGWFWWGLAGYFAALPLVIVVSLVNQKIWQGQGGSNPILPIALEERNSVALFIFFVTAAVAAPIFEEILFRGFLLSSLTRYMPMWGAIALSSLIFAIAHLSLSEVLPLTVLGMVLGFVYSRSRNLFSSMLLHGLWNSGTLLSLVILGSGQS